MEISQVSVDFTYWFSISIDGKQLKRVVNMHPAEFTNVKVYAADNWYDAVKGKIRHLKYQSKRSV